MVTYFYHHLSDNNADLSDLYVVLPDLYVDLFVFCICLFVCLAFIVPLDNFSLIWTRHRYRWRASNFDLCLALMAIKQWGFFRMPHLLWHGASVHDGHLWGPVTLTIIAERLEAELSLPVFTTKICRGWDSNTQPSVFVHVANDLTHYASGIGINFWNIW